MKAKAKNLLAWFGLMTILIGVFALVGSIAFRPHGQYAGIVYGYVDGKIAIAQIAGVAPSRSVCLEKMHAVEQGVAASAPPGASVVVDCVPVPAP